MPTEGQRGRVENVSEVLKESRLYGIIDLGYVAASEAMLCARELMNGGVRILQLRAKGVALPQVEELGRALQAECRARGVVFVLNDYPELATEIGADAVHVGQDAGELAEVRRMVGDKMLIGRSTHSLEQVQRAREEGADYIGYGPLFPTATKPGRPAIGTTGIASAQEIAGEMPMFCIGGVNETTLPEVLSAGARRVVVVSWLLQQPDRTAAARKLLQQIEQFS